MDMDKGQGAVPHLVSWAAGCELSTKAQKQRVKKCRFRPRNWAHSSVRTKLGEGE